MTTTATRRQAEVLAKQGKCSEASAKLEGLENYLAPKSLDDILEKVNIYFTRTWLLRVQGKIEKALEQCRLGLEIIKGCTENLRQVRLLQAKGLNNLASIYYSTGDYDRAIECYKKDIKIAEGIDDKSEVGIACTNLGLVYYYRDDYRKALQLFSRYLNITEKTGDKRGIGIASNHIGFVHFAQAEYKKAATAFSKYLSISEEIGFRQGVSAACGNLGNIYFLKGEYDCATVYFKKDIAISQAVGDKRCTGIGLANLANICETKGEIERALVYLAQSLANLQSANDKRSTAIVHCAMGRVLMLKKEWKRAYEYLQRSSRVLQEIKNNEALIDVFLSLSELSLKWKRSAALAARYLRQAVNLAHKLSLKEKKADCDFTTGAVYTHKKNYILAAKYLCRARSIYKKIGLTKRNADACLELGKTFLNLAKCRKSPGRKYLKSARKLLNQALTDYKKIKIAHKVREVSVLLKSFNQIHDNL